MEIVNVWFCFLSVPNIDKRKIIKIKPDKIAVFLMLFHEIPKAEPVV